MFFPFYKPRRIQNGLLVIDDDGILVDCDETATDIEIPKNVVAIDDGSNVDYVFQKARLNLKSVSFEANSQLQEIGKYAFHYCTKLETIDLSNCNSLTNINNWAFSYCYSLKTLRLTSSIKSLQENAFRSVHVNMSFDLSNLVYIEGISFVNTSFSFNCSNSSTLLREYENNIYNIDYTKLQFVSFSTKTLRIHEKTTTIGNCCFSSSSLEEIILPPQIKAYSNWAWHMNDYVKKIVFSEGTKTIAVNYLLLSYLPRLEIIYFPEGLKEMKGPIIDECQKLKIIHFPSTLKTIEEGSFDVPSTKFVTYEKSQYFTLLKAGIPRSALLHFHTACHCSYHSFLVSVFPYVLLI